MVRIALCGLPAMVDDIVEVLTRQVPEVEIVGRIDFSGDIEADLARSGADLLVCGMASATMERGWGAAGARRSPLAVLNLGTTSERGCLYSLHSHRERVEPLT